MDGEYRQSLCNADSVAKQENYNGMDNNKYTEGITDQLKLLIKEDVNSGIDRPMAAYLQRAMEAIKRRFQTSNKWSRYNPWSTESTEEITKLWVKYEPEIVDCIEKYLQEFKHKKLTKDIKATAAKAAIRAAMQEAGIKHQFTGQTHRAKVSVLLAKRQVLTFYISYKKLHEQLPHIINSLKIIKQELEYLGSNVSINNKVNHAAWE